ncbi:MAG: FtsQ-type POTRA domain-containing protein [Clostridiales bacterium]|nr:FtsQ-type POTRA domain-containing protein [Clostridiales bacterium]
MNDSELDRLFGNDGESDKGPLKEDNKAPGNKPEHKKRDGKRVEKRKPEKEKSEEKKPEDKEEKKQSAEDKEEGKSSDEVTEEKADKTAEEEKKEAPEESDKESDKESEKESDKESEEDSEEEPGEESKEGSEEDSEKDSGEEKEVKEDEEAGDEEKAEENKEQEIKKKDSVPPNARKKRPEHKPVPEEKNGIGSIADSIPISGKSLLVIFLALALVIMVVLLMFLPAFRVRNTHIEGNVAITDQEILKAVGLEYDAHLMSGVSGNIFDILRLDYGKTEEQIKKNNPYIEDIRITIKIPSTVEIKVKERSKICYIRTPDGYAALDKDGIVLELSSFDSGRSVRPVICGLNVKSAELGKPVQIENMNDYKKSIIVLGAILAADNASVGGNYSMFENTSEVRILPSGYIFLTIYSPSGNLIQIKLAGTDSIGDNMAWLLYAFNADAFDKVTVNGALDMTGDEYVFKEYE